MHKYSHTIGTYKNNISENERLLSALAGAALLGHGLVGKKNFLETLVGAFFLYRSAAGHCPAYAAIGKTGINFHTKNIAIKTSVTVNKPIAEVYSFWRNLENLPHFMLHLESIQITGEKTSLWKAKVPGGLGTVNWESTIVLDQLNERIGWKSNDDALIENAGTVHFKDGGKFGTEVHAHISYHAPAGKLGEGVGRLLNPVFEAMVREDIKNFKRFIESGEIPTIGGQASGKNKL